MLQRFTVAIKKWLALRSFPKGWPTSSYVFVGVYSPFGLHDRVMIFEHNGSVYLHFRSNEAFPRKNVNAKVTHEALRGLFRWIDQLLPNRECWSFTIGNHDPVELTIFAFDAEYNITYSAYVCDTRSPYEFRSVPGELLNQIRKMAPLAFTQ